MSSFGENLQKIRKEKKLTLRELAHIMGTSAANISHYEKGIRNPKPETILKFREALNCSFEDLGLHETYWGIYELDTPTIEIKTDGYIQPLTNELIESSLDYLNNVGKQKVFEYINDIKENPKYKSKDGDIPTM